jgi:hypothetical protein
MSFADLKKQSRLGTLTSKLVQEVEKMSSSKTVDERFWKPEMDKGGTGYAVIRFLPPPENEDLPWVQLYSHGFQGPGGWYIENSLTTLNKKDPVTEYNRSLVIENGGVFEKCPQKIKDIVRNQKRKLSYYSNIYVVKDPLHPENEGKVFLFKYGKKVYDKILAKLEPEFQDEEKVNVFDFWSGANFKLKIVKKDGYWNYDNSEFAAPSALLDDDEELEQIWKKQHSLNALLAPDQFKSYEELETRLNNVLGIKSSSTKAASAFKEEDQYESYSSPNTSTESVMDELERSYTKSKSAPPVPDSMKKELDSLSEEEDDAMSYFKGLIED